MEEKKILDEKELEKVTGGWIVQEYEVELVVHEEATREKESYNDRS